MPHVTHLIKWVTSMMQLGLCLTPQAAYTYTYLLMNYQVAYTQTYEV